MEDFLSTHALYERGEASLSLEPFAGIPEHLASALTRVNGNTYASGFFRFVSPDRFRRYLSLWRLNPGECFPFLKCAFGHLVFLHEQHFKMLDPVFNEIEVLGEIGEIEAVMDVILCDREALEGGFMIDVYEEAFPRLGAPRADEVYAFVPPLAMGGARSAASVQIRKMDVEMPILAQV